MASCTLPIPQPPLWLPPCHLLLAHIIKSTDPPNSVPFLYLHQAFSSMHLHAELLLLDWACGSWSPDRLLHSLWSSLLFWLANPTQFNQHLKLAHLWNLNPPTYLHFSQSYGDTFILPEISFFDTPLHFLHRRSCSNPSRIICSIHHERREANHPARFLSSQHLTQQHLDGCLLRQYCSLAEAFRQYSISFWFLCFWDFAPASIAETLQSIC